MLALMNPKIIYCGFKRFKFNEKMQLWHDTVNNIKIIKELYEELIAVNTGHLATVSQNAGPPNVAVSSVTLLAGGLDLWWNHYLERKQTSWNAGREVDRLHANWIAEFMTRSQSTKPWIDTFGDMLDATLLHEVCPNSLPNPATKVRPNNLILCSSHTSLKPDLPRIPKN